MKIEIGETLVYRESKSNGSEDIVRELCSEHAQMFNGSIKNDNAGGNGERTELNFHF